MLIIPPQKAAVWSSQNEVHFQSSEVLWRQRQESPLEKMDRKPLYYVYR